MEAVREVANGLTEAKLCLQPRPGTPISSLIESTYIVEEDVKGMEPTVSSVVEAANTKGTTGIVEHSERMEEIVTVAATSVGVILHHARNVFLPMAKEVENIASEMVSELSSSTPNHPIVMSEINPIFDNQSLGGMVERYAEHPSRTIVTKDDGFPLLSAVDLEKMLSTGISNLDEDVQSLLKDSPDGTLVYIYNSTFTREMLDPVDVDPSTKSVILFLLTRSMLDVVPSGVNMELPKYRMLVSEVMARSARDIFHHGENIARNTKQNKLVIRQPIIGDMSSPIVVSGEVYRKWLKEGGSPEILLGSALSGFVDSSYYGLLQNGEQHKSTYKRAKSLNVIANGADRVLNVRRSVRRALERIVEAGDDSIREDKQVVLERLYKVLEECELNANTPLVHYVREVTHKALYPHTDSLKVVREVDSICALNKEMSPREAATLVVIDIVTDWAASQYTVESV
jgi:hypothetical protein